MLRQNGPLMWLPQAHSDLFKVTSEFDIAFHLALKARDLARRTYNRGLENRYSQSLCVDSISFQEMVVGFTSSLDNHMPLDKHLTALSQLPIIVKLHNIPSSRPTPKATMASSDANNARHGVLTQRWEEKDITHIFPNPGSVQLEELFGLMKIFECCQQKPLFFQIANMEYKLSIPCPSPITKSKTALYMHVCILSIQSTLENRAHPLFISHVRSHSKLPGTISRRKQENYPDNGCGHGIARTRQNSTPALFHLSPQNLHKFLPELPMSQCKHLARSCATCVPLAPLGPFGRSGVNPRGLLPNAIWQIGVTITQPLVILGMFMLWWIRARPLYTQWPWQVKGASC